MHPCKKCALEGESCCITPFQEHENCEDDGISITLSEVLRISKKTGLDPDDFCFVRTMSDAYYEDADETVSGMAPNGKSIELRPKNGQCPFLGKNGCTIFENRPMICRLYPFWFTTKTNGALQLWKNRTDSLDEEGCVLHQMCWNERSVKKCIALIGEDYNQLVKAIRVFQKEIQLMGDLSDEIGKTPLKKLIKANEKKLLSFKKVM